MPALFIITSYTIVQSVILAVKFLFQKKRSFRALLFSFLLMIIALDMSNSLLFSTGYIYNTPFFLRVQTPLTFLYGPIIYLIIVSYSGKDKFTKLDWLHLIPFFLVLLSLIPTYLLQIDDKLVYIKSLMETGHPASIVYGLLRRIHIFAYLIVALIPINKTEIQRKSVLKIWFTFFGIWLISIYRLLFDFQVSAIYLDMVYINIVIIYFAYVFSKEIKLAQPSNVDDKEELIKIMDKIDRFLVEEEGYKNSLVSVSSLSKKLHIPNYKISKAINSTKGMHFFDYLNQLRINKATLLLKSHPDKKIDSVATEVGYNSISVFNTAFKKVTNTTPREFRKLSTS